MLWISFFCCIEGDSEYQSTCIFPATCWICIHSRLCWLAIGGKPRQRISYWSCLEMSVTPTDNSNWLCAFSKDYLSPVVDTPIHSSPCHPYLGLACLVNNVFFQNWKCITFNSYLKTIILMVFLYLVCIIVKYKFM